MVPPRFRSLVDPTAPPARLAKRFTAAGYDLFLVGGTVRDLMLGLDLASDFDFTTNARPAEIKRLVSDFADTVYTAGEAFGTVGLTIGGVVCEITTYRSEVYRDDSRKPVVEFSDELEMDLSRRDFTVNAMALRLPDPGMIDPYGGLADIEGRLLRTPLQPEISFGDDPLRMLRLYRFVSTLGFRPDAAAEEAVESMRARLGIVSAERIRDEFDKLMMGPHVGEALRGLVRTGLMEEFLPEFPALALEMDPVHRHKDVLAHTIAVIEKAPPDDLTTRLAALFHDVGKPATRSIDGGRVAFHHHEVVGARLTRERMRALRYPKQVVGDVSQLVYLHMRPHTYKLGWTDRAVRRYVRDAGPLLARLNTLVRCDVTTRNERRERAISRRIDELEERIAELGEREELDRLRPPIDGHEVMEHLGVEPGPVVGEAMAMLLERRIDEGPYDADEAFRVLDEWWAARRA